eukprot:scaffold20333_cov64-Phaeocystis_antarctica.AAC.11
MRRRGAWQVQWSARRCPDGCDRPLGLGRRHGAARARLQPRLRRLAHARGAHGRCAHELRALRCACRAHAVHRQCIRGVCPCTRTSQAPPIALVSTPTPHWFTTSSTAPLLLRRVLSERSRPAASAAAVAVFPLSLAVFSPSLFSSALLRRENSATAFHVDVPPTALTHAPPLALPLAPPPALLAPPSPPSPPSPRSPRSVLRGVVAASATASSVASSVAALASVAASVAALVAVGVAWAEAAAEEEAGAAESAVEVAAVEVAAVEVAAVEAAAEEAAAASVAAVAGAAMVAATWAAVAVAAAAGVAAAGTAAKVG